MMHEDEENQGSLRTGLDELLAEPPSSAAKRSESAFRGQTEPLSDRLVLFGAGGLGRRTLAGLRTVGIEPLAFVDNDSALWGHAVDGLRVESPQQAASKYASRAAFVVTIWRAGGTHRFTHTRKQLHDLNCSRVVSFAALYWQYPNLFLPYYAIDLPTKLLQQAEEVRQAWSLWSDESSRREYLAQIRWRLLLDFDALSSPVPHLQYFPDDLYQIDKREVFVDCGAYDGDSMRPLLEQQPAFLGRVIAIEPDAHSREKLERYVGSLAPGLRSRIQVLPYAVGDRHYSMPFSDDGTSASALRPDGNVEVECQTLDEILRETVPTFIKMDIESSELDALRGAECVLKRSMPILAISAYHRQDHLWRVPLFIRSISKEYRLFLRPHNEEGWDLVCYAVPPNRLAMN